MPIPPPLDPAAVEAAVAAGATLVDARPAAVHAAGHVPGSISIPLEDSFGTWLGWVVDLDRPVVLIPAQPGDLDPLMRQAIRIGRDDVAGYLDGGVEAWAASGRPVETSGRLSIDELAAALSRIRRRTRPRWSSTSAR